MDLILLFSSLAFFIVYVLAVCFKFGIPYSLSESFYLMKYGHIFSVALFFIVLLLMPAFIDYSQPSFQFLAFLPAAALTFVAAAPHFKEEDERKIHVGATVVCALCSQAWVAIHSPWCLLMWLAFILYMVIRVLKMDEITAHNLVECKPTFWAEMTAFATTYLALILVAL